MRECAVLNALPCTEHSALCVAFNLTTDYEQPCLSVSHGQTVLTRHCWRRLNTLFLTGFNSALHRWPCSSFSICCCKKVAKHDGKLFYQCHTPCHNLSPSTPSAILGVAALHTLSQGLGRRKETALHRHGCLTRCGRECVSLTFELIASVDNTAFRSHTVNSFYPLKTFYESLCQVSFWTVPSL